MNLNSYLILPLLLTFFGLILLPIVLKGHFRSPVHRLFSFYLVGMIAYGVFIFFMRSSPTLEQAHLWDELAAGIGLLWAVILYHFSARFTGIITKKWLLPSAYAVSLIFFILSVTGFVISGMQIKPYGYAPIVGPLFMVMALLGYTFFIMAAINFWKAARSSPYAEERNRSAYIFAGLVISMVGAAFDMLPLLGLPLYPGFIIGNIAFCLLTTVAIMRHNLLDIRVVLRKSTAYFLMSALIALPFMGIFLLATYVFTEVTFPSWAYFVVAIMLALVLPQLWRWVQRWVDRWFYRDRYDYLEAIETFSRETQSLADSAKPGSTMVNLIAKVLRSSNVFLLQPLSSSRDFTTAFSAGVNNPTPVIRLESRGGLVEWLERSNSMLSYEDIELIPQLQGATFKEKQTIQQVGAELIVPLMAPTGQLSGVLILGKKLSEQPYTVEDKQLVYAICNQISANLENARLYSESQHEVAERKQAEEREKELQGELNLASRLAAVGELAAGVAHEMNNPLTGILGFSERLSRKSTDDDTKESLELIHYEAQRLAKVVKNLLTFARRREPKKEYADINDILQTTLDLRAYELKTGNIEVALELAANLPQIMVDFHQIQEVFVNIILNAEQVMTEASGGGKLTIKTRQIKDYIRVSFTDDGPGIPAKDLGKVFNPFFTTKGERGGTGLGLSVCHGIVTEHGGRIYARSRPGSGATFLVDLPLTSSQTDESQIVKEELAV